MNILLLNRRQTSYIASIDGDCPVVGISQGSSRRSVGKYRIHTNKHTYFHTPKMRKCACKITSSEHLIVLSISTPPYLRHVAFFFFFFFGCPV